MVEEASNVWYLYTLRVEGQPCLLKLKEVNDCLVSKEVSSHSFQHRSCLPF